MAFAVPLVAAATGGVALPWLGASASIGSMLGNLSIGSLIGPAFNLLGGIQQHSAQQEAANYNIALHNYNAEIAERNAKLSLDSAALAADESRRETRRRLGTIRSKFGKAGVVTTSGSPLLALEEQAAEGDFEARKILFGGEVEAFGHRSEASIQRMKAGFEAKKKKSNTSESLINFGGKILTGTGVGTSLLG